MPTTSPAELKNCDPFFIVGTGRCGSSMLRRILRTHPDLVIPNETHWIALLHDEFELQPTPLGDIENVIRSLRTGRGKSILDRICEEESLDSESLFRQIGTVDERLTWREFHERFAAILTRNSGASCWGDKTPDYGACVDIIAQAWPEACFIHLVRDGRDVALSMSKVPSFQQLAQRRLIEWKHLARQLPDCYAGNDALPVDRYFELWLQRIKLTTRLLQSVPNNRVFELRYEDLLRSPTVSLTRLAAFLNVAAPDAWLAPAVEGIRPDNAYGNQSRPEYRQLSRNHNDALRWFDNQFPTTEPALQS